MAELPKRHLDVDLHALALALAAVDAAAATSLAILIAAYPELDEEVAFDPRAAEDDPFEAAAEIRFLTQSLRLAIRRHRRLARRAADQSARTAEAQRAR